MLALITGGLHTPDEVRAMILPSERERQIVNQNFPVGIGDVMSYRARVVIELDRLIAKGYKPRKLVVLQYPGREPRMELTPAQQDEVRKRREFGQSFREIGRALRLCAAVLQAREQQHQVSQ